MKDWTWNQILLISGVAIATLFVLAAQIDPIEFKSKTSEKERLVKQCMEDKKEYECKLMFVGYY